MTSFLLLATLGLAPQTNLPSLIPAPSQVRFNRMAPFTGGGVLTISCPQDCTFEENAVRDLFQRCGFDTQIVGDRSSTAGADSAEGYRIEIAPSKIRISSATSAGAFYAVQTLRQLLPPAIENGTVKNASIPSGSIFDMPRFPWRGMLFDVSRHFFPPKDIKHILDLLAMQKMNVFHWHLVDDGGWRLEIKRYPNLTRQGAFRRASKAVWDYRHLDFPPKGAPGPRYGGYYTQSQIKDIVRYAADRHITIVPEIEMPGHSLAALESYPELACKVPDIDFQKASTMPSKNVYCAGKEGTFKFLENVLDEVFELFPSKIIHIGGDEVDKYLYNHCPDCQKRMVEEHLASADELQSYFIKRIERYVNSKGRRLMGWDEILQGGLAPNAAVMSWRGIAGGIEAAEAGHDVVMTPTSHCYFDYTYNQISTDHVLDFQPVPVALAGKDAAAHVLGAQCNLWTEWVPDRATAEQRLFPRILAMAEVLWSGDSSLTTFDSRLGGFYSRLQNLGINFYLPEPEAEFNAVMVDPDAKIVLKPTPIAGASIRYTIDGSEPTLGSKLYTAPLDASFPLTVNAATFLPSGQKSESIRVEVASQTIDSVEALKPGLAYSVYEGNFERVPDFTVLKPVASGETPQFGLVGNRLENYALSINGAISVPTTGIYRFFLSSDDGSNLWIGGAKVVDNDGPHGTIEKSGRMYLKAGSYPIRVGYYQGSGAQSLQLCIEGPQILKQEVPLAWLRH